jgi:hypothetical protein
MNKGENVDKEQIYEEIKKRSKNGQISCQQCFEAAKTCDAALKQIGSICNEKKIKIRFCQLGCFE